MLILLILLILSPGAMIGEDMPELQRPQITKVASRAAAGETAQLRKALKDEGRAQGQMQTPAELIPIPDASRRRPDSSRMRPGCVGILNSDKIYFRTS